METKVALITGSTSGIGMAIANKFAAEGIHIIFNGLEKEGPEIAKEMGQKYKVKTWYSPADMLKPEEIADMLKGGEKRVGKD